MPDKSTLLSASQTVSAAVPPRVISVGPVFAVAVGREVGCRSPRSYQRMIAEPVDADFHDQLPWFNQAGVFVREKLAFDHY